MTSFWISGAAFRQYRSGDFFQALRSAVSTIRSEAGYKGTPEDVLLRAAELPYPQRRELLQAADHNVAYRVLHEGNVDVIKWYHDNGIPQVKQIVGPLFAELEYF